jgi:hypothetical protein
MRGAGTVGSGAASHYGSAAATDLALPKRCGSLIFGSKTIALNMLAYYVLYNRSYNACIEIFLNFLLLLLFKTFY